jgi:hypothetical protein
MKKLTVKTVRAFFNIVTSGYSDRYSTADKITVYADLGGDEITISAIDFHDAARQLAVIAQAVGDKTTELEFNKEMPIKFEGLIHYRDGCKYSTVKTSSSIIGYAIGFYTEKFSSYSEIGKENSVKAVEKISREELLGIKQQMDALNALIKAGLKKGEVVEFNWVDQ